ncbi:MAG: YlbG family protein [Lactobacillus sp.]|nr:YlbG family protein [Lactobacillus sp.]
MSFEAKARRGVIVYLYHLRQSKQLRRFGNIQYVSRKMKYALVYMDEELVDKTVSKLKQLRFVKRVEISRRPDLKVEFDEQNQKAYKLTEEDQEKFENKES